MRILVAEDDPISRHILESFLTQWGYDVIVANDGDEAWWTLQREDAPNLAILDWMMPGMDGTQVCREVRKRVSESYTYIILLTAKNQKQDVVQGMDAGADDYLSKPFDADELRVRLRAGRRILDMQEQLLSMRDAARFPNTHDFMTGLWNREAILGMVRQKLGRERHDSTPVGIVLVEIDHFRQINQYGPAAGDAVVREAARRLRACVRLYDSVGRYGSAGFLIVVPGCYSAEVAAIAEKAREAISREPIDILGGVIEVTASVAVATTDENKNADADVLLRAVEEAIRRAKSQHNRVEIATSTDGITVK